MEGPILIADDNKELLQLLKSVFTCQGHEVVLTDTGDKVTELVTEKHPSLIFLDVFMGNKDGREICRELKTNDSTKDIPVVMISGIAGATDFQFEFPPDEVLPKPFDVKMLIDTVGKYYPYKPKLKIRS
jgi:CheY-like chemotaxis protein